MSATDLYVCAVTPEQAPARLDQIRALRRGLRARERDGGRVRLRFDPELSTVLEGFVRDESECCSFYDFDFERTGEELRLSVRAPSEADALLQSLFEIFDPDRAEPSAG